MANCIIEEQNLYNIADAIRSKNGESTLYKPSEMATKISEISSSQSVNPNNPVKLLDYDGTIIASYTKQDFNNLTEYPNPPSHEDLIFDEYNWTLQEAKTYISDHDEIDIGAIYKTENDATYIYVDIYENQTLPISYAINGNSLISLDNGTTYNMNGTSESVPLLQSISNLPSGLTRIKITTENDAKIVISGNANGSLLVTGAGTQNVSYLGRVKKIVFGNVKLASNALKGMNGCCEYIFTNKCEIDMSKTNMFNANRGVKHVNFPRSMTSLASNMFNASSVETICLSGNFTQMNDYVFSTSSIRRVLFPNSTNVFYMNAFNNAYNLKYIQLPNIVTNLAGNIFSGCHSIEKIKLPTMTNYTANYNNLFQNCYTLSSVEIPEQYTYIGTYMFSTCTSLLYLKLPKNINTIGNYAFDGSALKVIDCTELLQVPSLGTAPSNMINNSYKFVVPDSLYENWIATTNWSNITSHIIKESDFNN